MPVGRLALLAHRGARLSFPENSAEAIAGARAAGADGIELDVQLSADGEPFLFHDRTGARVAGVSGPLGALAWRDIKRLRAFGKHEILHLHDAIEALEAWPQAQVFFDLHSPSEKLAAATARALASSGLRERASILTFYANRSLLTAASRLGARIAVMPGAPWNIDASLELGACALCVGWDRPATKYLYKAACLLHDPRPGLERARRAGAALSGGVANTPDEVAYFVRQGLTAVWTDDLDMARSAASRLAAQPA